MSFFTSLTGLNAATTQLSVTSNNIANAGTTGFKRSRSDFGDIFATSPLQKASTVVGQGTALKQVTQEFSQGNIELSGNSLDLAVTGEGFFPLSSSDNQELFTRNGSFMLNEQNVVVNSAGQSLKVAAVDSLGKADFEAGLIPLQIAPKTVGEAIATSAIDFQINFPGDSAPILETDPETSVQTVVPFNAKDPSTYAKSAAVTIFDANGEDYLLTFYYRRTQEASSTDPESKWQTHILLNDQELKPTLSQATDTAGNRLWVNKYGEIRTENDLAVRSIPASSYFKKYNLDDLGPVQASKPAVAIGQVATGIEYQKGALGQRFNATPSTITFETQASGTDSVAPNTPYTFKLKVGDNDEVDVTIANSSSSTVAALVREIDGQLAKTPGLETVTASLSSSGQLVLTETTGSNLDFVPPSSTDNFETRFGAVDTEVPGEQAPSLSFDMRVDVDLTDDTNQKTTIDLSALTQRSSTLSGDQVASIMQAEINRQLGDGRKFSIDSTSSAFSLDLKPAGSSITTTYDIVLTEGDYTPEELAEEMQSEIRSTTGERIDVTYSYSDKAFSFGLPSLSDVAVLKNTSGSVNTLLGLNTSASELPIDAATGLTGIESTPQGGFIVPENLQRTGIEVTFVASDGAGSKDGYFKISSGKTGDLSSIEISNVSGDAVTLFGFDVDKVSSTKPLAVDFYDGFDTDRGVESSPARLYGTPVQFDPNEAFPVEDTENEFTVTVDSITETFSIPASDYNLNGFMTTLQNRINAMSSKDGRAISGVIVDFDADLNRFFITSGTTGDSSFVQILGNPKFGLSDLGSAIGKTATYREPVAEQTSESSQTVYVQLDQVGGDNYIEYDTDSFTEAPEYPSDGTGVANPQAWSPLFLDKGELTFDTAGRLISPLDGINLENVVVGADTISIDYAGSTQFTGDFSVMTQSQNGEPNGSLVAVDIADDGLVTASYSNGTQDLKGKIVLATFSTPNGLRQLGDSTFLESNESGAPRLGEPGGAGFGTIRAGARERANVDLTSELVDLITAQRNFQANAKAIETSSTLTSTIINIRS